MTFSLCPAAACVHGHVPGFKTAPGVYPCPRMGKVLLYFSFIHFFHVNETEKSAFAAFWFACLFRLHKSAQLYRIARVLVRRCLRGFHGVMDLLHLVPFPDSTKVLKCVYPFLPLWNLRAREASASCVFYPALRAGPQTRPSLTPVVAGAITGPRSAVSSLATSFRLGAGSVDGCI